MNILNFSRSYLTNQLTESELKHREELIKTAMPYASSQNQQSMNTILKTTELLHTLIKKEPELSTCSMNTANSGGNNLESLLNSLRPLCRGNELNIVTMLLNSLQAQKLYRTYQTVAASMEKEMQNSSSPVSPVNNNTTESDNSMDSENNTESYSNEEPILNAASIHPKQPTPTKQNVSFNQVMNNPQMRELLDTMMTPEQKTTFQNMSNIMNMMNAMNALNLATPNPSPTMNQPNSTNNNNMMNPANIVNMMNMLNSMNAAGNPNSNQTTNTQNTDSTPNSNFNNTFGNLSGYHANNRNTSNSNRNGLHTVHTMEITNPYDFEANPARTMDSLSDQFDSEL